MAKASYICPDCKTTLTISGYNRSEADRRARNMEQRGERCRDCENKIESEAAAEAAKAAGLPELTGSEKQIAWAEAIRARALKSLAAQIPDARRGFDYLCKGLPAEAWGEIDDAFALIESEIRGITAARTWIDEHSRGLGAGYVQNQIVSRGESLMPTVAAWLKAQRGK